MAMHAARISASPRLQRVLALLSDGGWHTTLDIVRGTGALAVSACVAELRAQGATIECEQYRAEEGPRRWRYRMTAPPPKAR